MVTKITDSSGAQHPVRDDRVQNATTENVGMVKPDGHSITIDDDGTIHGNASPFDTDESGYINYVY